MIDNLNRIFETTIFSTNYIPFFLRKMNKKTVHVAGKESFQRMNYLYQASELMLKINENVSTHYNNILLNVAKKSVLRIDTTIKTTLCKGCHVLLEPSNTTRLRFKKRNKHLRIKCLKCGTVKRILCNKNYKTWNDRPNSTLAVINFDNKLKLQTNECEMKNV